mgnify:CR=1 FL=1
MEKLITITFILCTTLLLHGQAETKVDRTKGFKIGLGYAKSSHIFGHTYNIEVTKPLNNNWQVTGFFEKLQKTHYSQLGLTIGKKTRLPLGLVRN